MKSPHKGGFRFGFPAGKWRGSKSMSNQPRSRRWTVALVLLGLTLGAGATRASAQLALYVEHEGKMHLVRSVSGVQPYIQVKGKLVPVFTDEFALLPVKEFLPLFVSVRKIETWTTVEKLYGQVAPASVNNCLYFSAKFESRFGLDDAFIVLDMKTEAKGHVLFVHQIGPLRPGIPDPVFLQVPMNSEIGAGKYRYHVFVKGMEVLTSALPPPAREAALDKMVADRVAGENEAPVRIFVGPDPVYPQTLLKAGTRGRAVVDFLVDSHGRVRDPKLRSATDPAFGTSALAAIRDWRFLPRIDHGRPVKTSVEMPFEFTPPH